MWSGQIGDLPMKSLLKWAHFVVNCMGAEARVISYVSMWEKRDPFT